NRDQVGAVIVEPIAGNMGVVPPADGFLRGLREICTAEHAVLIFDEVISGFRASIAGAQGLANVRPDLTCLGKIIGGGLPVGAYGGRADLMDLVSPAANRHQDKYECKTSLALNAASWSHRQLAPHGKRELPALPGRIATRLC